MFRHDANLASSPKMDDGVMHLQAGKPSGLHLELKTCIKTR